ncbi:MAG: hypothetical protein GY792_11095 [Gammaproteobacteria bacterium]|nr:hypothetical protein [Gammaproteobacteria bacterium]
MERLAAKWHDVTDEVRELINRLTQLQQGIGALIVNAFQPRCNRGLRDEEGVSYLFERPPPRAVRSSRIGMRSRAP